MGRSWMAEQPVEAKLMVGAVDRMPDEAILLLEPRSRPGNAELKCHLYLTSRHNHLTWKSSFTYLFATFTNCIRPVVLMLREQ